MQIDLNKPMLKAFAESERVVTPATTIATVRERAGSLGIDLVVTTWQHGGVFWTARMSTEFRAQLPESLRSFRLAGKGPSEAQCTASCLMEFAERFSQYRFVDRDLPEYDCLDLRTGEWLKIGRMSDMRDTKCVSAGNNHEEAILHSLHELIETRLFRSCLWQPFKRVELASLFPELPGWVQESLVVIKTPSDVPEFHHFTALKYPSNGQFDEPAHDRVMKREGRLFWTPTHRPLNWHSPNSGSAAGLNPRLTAFRAMNEVFQTDFVDLAPPPTRVVPRAETAGEAELVSCESPSITSDINRILGLLGPETFVGVIDLTDPDLGIPVVKLVSDYNPHRSLASRENMRRFFAV